MNPTWCSLIPFFGHKSCKDKINKLIQEGLNDSKEIQSLNCQMIGLINENQELKAMHDYQCFKLEKTITELREKLKSRRSRRKTTKVKST
jgi:hypothetical protein